MKFINALVVKLVDTKDLKSLIYFLSLFNIFFLNFSAVHAYVGPGMGGGLIAATLGIILAIFAALFAIIWFPFKRFLKKRKDKRDNENKKI